MGKIIDCKEIKNKKLPMIKQMIGKNETPTLCIVQVGNDPASNTYTNNKKKLAEEVGVNCIHMVLDEKIKYEYIKQLLTNIGKDNNVNGIILQLPLPSHLKQHEQDLIDCIPFEKDVDGLTTINIGKLHSGHPYTYPCTAQACMDILNEYKYSLQGKNVLIIGRQNLLGIPLSRMILDRNATVTIAHSYTEDLDNMLESGAYDVVVSAVGIPKHFKRICADFILDVGINRDENGKLCGDIDLSTCQFDYATTVGNRVGGLGQLTVLNLLINTIQSYMLLKENR